MIQQIALTGGIACGKSVAESCFSACGCRVLDADAVVETLEASGGAAVTPIVARFGKEVLNAQGGIDRRVLAMQVFANASARMALEAIVHPLVHEVVEQWLAVACKDEISIFSAALLYESGWDAQWPYVVCVMASEATQVRRMMSVRGMSEAEARSRLAAQMPVAEKSRRATWTVQNDSDDLSALRMQIETLVALWRTGTP
ncbi:MAG: dephospho-CoA kinase [Kiritimatiellia bacterium]